MFPALERFKSLFNELDRHCLDRLDEVYAPDVHFRDPVHELRGLPALKAYYARLYEGVESCRFRYDGEVIEAGGAVVLWTMQFRHRRFRAGETLTLEGATHLAFGHGDLALVSRHRDYFDMGEFLYERVPVLGTVIRHIKSGL